MMTILCDYCAPHIGKPPIDAVAQVALVVRAEVLGEREQHRKRLTRACSNHMVTSWQTYSAHTAIDVSSSASVVSCAPAAVMCQ